MSLKPTVTARMRWAPRVWALMSHKAGDNSQVLALAEGLGWPFEIKRFVYRKTELATNLLIGVTLAGIVKDKSSSLEPPWPDIVISAGCHNEPVCRWIQKQADKRVRIVHIGRPWAGFEHFDLVITTPQYRLPKHPVVLHNETPLHRVSEGRLAEAAALWGPRLAHLPRPYIAVTVGGNSGPYTFDRNAAERLGREASAMANAAGGSLLVTTSARTNPAAAATLDASIECSAYLYTWEQDVSENPYFGFLALADSIIVTGDSISMLTEACATRKPVHIFDLGEGRNAMRPLAASEQGSQSWSPRRWQSWDNDYIRASIYKLGMYTGPRRLTRDIRIVHDILVSSGHAVWLGDGFPEGKPRVLGDLARAVAHVAALFDPLVTPRSEVAGNYDAELAMERAG